MDTVRRNGTEQGIIRLSDTVLLENDFVDTVEDKKVTGDRVYCARLHTTSRTYYLQFDTIEERESFVAAIKQVKSE